MVSSLHNSSSGHRWRHVSVYHSISLRIGVPSLAPLSLRDHIVAPNWGWLNIIGCRRWLAVLNCWGPELLAALNNWCLLNGSIFHHLALTRSIELLAFLRCNSRVFDVASNRNSLSKATFSLEWSSCVTSSSAWSSSHLGSSFDGSCLLGNLAWSLNRVSHFGLLNRCPQALGCGSLWDSLWLDWSYLLAFIFVLSNWGVDRLFILSTYLLDLFLPINFLADVLVSFHELV